MTNVWGILHCYMTGDPVFGISKFDRNAVPQPFVIDARRVASAGVNVSITLQLPSQWIIGSVSGDRRNLTYERHLPGGVIQTFGAGQTITVTDAEAALLFDQGLCVYG